MRGLPSILSLFRNEFNKFNNTGTRMLDSTYHMALKYLQIAFLVSFPYFTQRYNRGHYVSRKSVNH